MGCNCNKKKAIAPSLNRGTTINLETAEWGPIFWRILHGMVELTGRASSRILDMQEYHKWNDFINSIADAIPCTDCRAHFRQYMTTNKPEPLLRKSFIERRNGLREWFYNLHSNTPKINTVDTPTIEELPTIYKDVHFRADFKTLLSYLSEAVRLDIVKSLMLYKFKRNLNELLLFLGVAGNAL